MQLGVVTKDQIRRRRRRWLKKETHCVRTGTFSRKKYIPCQENPPMFFLLEMKRNGPSVSGNYSKMSKAEWLKQHLQPVSTLLLVKSRGHSWSVPNDHSYVLNHMSDESSCKVNHWHQHIMNIMTEITFICYCSFSHYIYAFQFRRKILQLIQFHKPILTFILWNPR